MYGSKKPKFRGKEASSLLSRLKINAPLTKIPLVDPVVLRAINKLKQSIKWIK